ncbi:MAG: Ig-like domain-containing protein, partial [Ginsengibacter sp.]
MKRTIHLFNLRITLIFVSVSTCYLSSAQWVRKADGLKPRSDLGQNVVYNSKLYVFAGFSDTLRNAESSSEVYDPATNTWAYLASLPDSTAMTHEGAILIDSTVWLIGGRVGQNPAPLTSAIWIYNIATNTWSKGPQITDPGNGKPMLMAGAGYVLLGRVLHIFGGFITTACNNDQYKYHLTLDVDTWLSNPSLPAQWENKLKSLPLKRNHLSSLTLGGKIYAIGGQSGHDCDGGLDVAYCDVYNPSTDSWSVLPPLPTGRSHAEGATFAIDGKIYITGGQGSDGKSTKYVTIFDPAGNNGAGSWTENLSLALPKVYEGFAGKIIGNNFIISHGSQGSSIHPQKITYSRAVVRNPVYKLGFPVECLKLSNAFGSSLKGHTWLYTIDGTKEYSASSNASWLVVSKNASGVTNPNATEIEITADITGLSPGNYNAVVTATGTGSGINYTSATLCVNLSIITPNAIPEISITNPADNADFTAPANITINATAADAEGTITKVDFYNGNTLLGSDSISPFTFTWNNVAAETYTLTAKATDNSSQVTTSSPVSILVKAPNAALTVSIINPVDYANFTGPANITVYATAADSNASISKVQFY